MARDERSAGIVLYCDDRTSNQRMYLLLDYGKHWDYPKGHVEKGETDQAAALRELAEETGITDARLVPGFAHKLKYYFRDKKHGLIRKTVVFFLAAGSSTDVTLSHEHVGFEFLPYESARRRLTYANARHLLDQANAFLAEAAPRQNVYGDANNRLG